MTPIQELMLGFVALHDRTRGFNPLIFVYMQIDAAKNWGKRAK